MCCNRTGTCSAVKIDWRRERDSDSHTGLILRKLLMNKHAQNAKKRGKRDFEVRNRYAKFS
jgi:hypothetical protein